MFRLTHRCRRLAVCKLRGLHLTDNNSSGVNESLDCQGGHIGGRIKSIPSTIAIASLYPGYIVYILHTETNACERLVRCRSGVQTRRHADRWSLDPSYCSRKRSIHAITGRDHGLCESPGKVGVESISLKDGTTKRHKIGTRGQRRARAHLRVRNARAEEGDIRRDRWREGSLRTRSQASSVFNIYCW